MSKHSTNYDVSIVEYCNFSANDFSFTLRKMVLHGMTRYYGKMQNKNHFNTVYVSGTIDIEIPECSNNHQYYVHANKDDRCCFRTQALPIHYEIDRYLEQNINKSVPDTIMDLTYKHLVQDGYVEFFFDTKLFNDNHKLLTPENARKIAPQTFINDSLKPESKMYVTEFVERFGSRCKVKVAHQIQITIDETGTCQPKMKCYQLNIIT